jgi:hypothetical protein
MSDFDKPSLTVDELRSRFIAHDSDMDHLLNGKIEPPFGDMFQSKLSSVADTPPPTLDKLKTLFTIKEASIFKHETKTSWDDIMQIDEQSLEDIFTERYPFRTKDDRKIRNIRFADVRLFVRLSAPGRQQILREVFNNNLSQLDYIFVCNFCLYICLIDESILSFWSGTSLLQNGTWGFVEVAGDLSNYIKTHKKTDRYRWDHLVEIGCLAGYKNPPIPDFNIYDKAKELAHGLDVNHRFIFNFTQYAKKKLTTQPKLTPDKITFREFIQKGDWATSGSSSEGKLTLVNTIDGTTKEIKCRKNFVLDSMTTDTLYDLALNATTQQNTTLLKCELGKIRLAVASDLGSYLCASYIVYHSGGCYLNWPGVTLEERTNDKITRLMETKGKLQHSVGVPFDFKSFDHQLTTTEIKVIVSVLCDAARINAYADPDFERVSSNVLNSFDHSFLRTRVNQEQFVMDVISGLMSGHRMTSIIGNGFNSIVSSMVIDGCIMLGEDKNDFYYNVQGDDTNIICRTKRQGLMALRLYQIMGIIFGLGKFSVQPQASEYLRVWLDAYTTRGYMARTLPNLTQRKPWSNTPWEPAGVMRGIWDKIGILKRRGCLHCEELWNTLSHRWCQLHGLPDASLCVPADLGGFGISVWDGKSTIQPPLPTMRKLGFNMVPKTSYREDKISERIVELGLSPVTFDIQALALDQLNGVVSGDDVPNAAIISRRVWKNLISSKSHICITKVFKAHVSNEAMQSYYWSPYSGSSWVEQVNWLKESTSLFGRFRREGETIRFISALNKHNHGPKIGVGKWIRDKYPNMYWQLQSMRSHGGMQAAIDYLTGDLNLCENIINNDVKDVFTRFVIKRINTKYFRHNVQAYYSLTRESLLSEFINNSVYQYCFAHV